MQNNNEIIIEPLQIIMSTNIPSNPEIDFTINSIHTPDSVMNLSHKHQLNKYPYLCTNYKYPVGTLKYASYDDIIRFFFDGNEMFLQIKKANLLNETKDNHIETEKYNIQTMMKLLFPTKFFTANNVHQSLDYLQGTEKFPYSFFFNPMKLRDTYMNIGGNPYTIVSVIWVNDILNHRDFKYLLKKTHFVNTSLDNESVNLNKIKKKQILQDTRNVPQTLKTDRFIRDDSISKLTTPLERHRIYLHNKLGMQKGQPIPNDYIKKYYHRTLPIFVESRKRYSNSIISGNEHLHNLIHGSHKEDVNEDSINDFYKTMDDIYKKYVLDVPNTKIKNEENLLYSGVDHIKDTKNVNNPTRRVYFTTEFIEGELNETNKFKITCQYTGEYLGSLYEDFFNNNTRPWKVKQVDHLYSVNDYDSHIIQRGTADNQVTSKYNVIDQINPLGSWNTVSENNITRFDEGSYKDFIDSLISEKILGSFDKLSEDFDLDYSSIIEFIQKEEDEFIKKEEDEFITLATKLIKNNTQGLLPEISKYYKQDYEFTNTYHTYLKKKWSLHKHTLKQLKMYYHENLRKDNKDHKRAEKKIKIIDFLIEIMVQAESLVNFV